MEIKISITEEDAFLVDRWLDYIVAREISNEPIPRNFVLLFCTLIKDSIKQQNG